MKINKSYAKLMPNNCPVQEYTADGDSVGVCTFHLKDGVCPRHGRVKSKANENPERSAHADQ